MDSCFLQSECFQCHVTIQILQVRASNRKGYGIHCVLFSNRITAAKQTLFFFIFFPYLPGESISILCNNISCLLSFVPACLPSFLVIASFLASTLSQTRQLSESCRFTTPEKNREFIGSLGLAAPRLNMSNFLPHSRIDCRNQWQTQCQIIGMPDQTDKWRANLSACHSRNARGPRLSGLREVGSRICAGNIGPDSLIPDPNNPKHISKYYTFYYNLRPIIDHSHKGV